MASTEVIKKVGSTMSVDNIDYVLDVLMTVDKLKSTDLSDDKFWLSFESVVAWFNYGDVVEVISIKDFEEWWQASAKWKDYITRKLSTDDSEMIQIHYTSLCQLFDDYSFRNVNYDLVG